MSSVGNDMRPMGVPVASTISLILLVQAGVDGRPTGSLQATNSYPPEDCRRPDEYWNGKECGICLKCPPGRGSDAGDCGHGFGVKGNKCEPCVEGLTYQENVSATGCKPCTLCDENAVVLSNCTVAQNTACGPCKPGYGPDQNHPGTCSLCIHFNDDEKPVECQTTPAPTYPPTPVQSSASSTTSAPGVASTTSSVIASGGSDEMTPSLDSNSLATTTNFTTPDSGSSGLNAGGIAGISIAILVIILVILCCCVRRRRKRPSQGNGTSSTLEKGTGEEKAGLTTEPNSGEPTIVTDIGKQEATYSASEAPVPNGDIPEPHHEPADPDVSTNLTRATVNNSHGGGEVEGDEIPPSAEGDQPGENDSTPAEQEGRLSSPVQVANNNNDPEIPAQSSKGNDVTDSSHPGQSRLPPIPEKGSDLQSSTGHCRRPKLKIFKRSFSAPAEGKSPPSPSVEGAPEDGTTLMLPPAARDKVLKKNKAEEVEKYNMDFNMACSIGSKRYWADLDNQCKREVKLMLTSRPSKPNLLSTYMELGESLGLNRNLELKTCQNVDDIFEVLATKKAITTLEDVLLALNKIDRKDVVKVIYKKLLKKSTLKCECDPLSQ